MPPAFTERLWHVGGSTGTFVTVFTVPIGKRVIVRNMVLLNNSAAAAELRFNIAGPNQYLWRFPNLPAHSSTDWEGRVALNAGDQVQALASDPAVVIEATGYVFEM